MEQVRVTAPCEIDAESEADVPKAIDGSQRGLAEVVVKRVEDVVWG